MPIDAWAEQYEAWLDERANQWLDEPAENECPMCGAEIDPDNRYCSECQDFV
jgi:hypothetical protein